MHRGHGPLDPPTPHTSHHHQHLAVDPVISLLFNPLKSVVAIFRINTLTPLSLLVLMLIRFTGKGRRMGKEEKSS